ncbi:MAG: hypothetical protein RLZZ76_236 [Candidatus Parcubacteria bacterium]|jgi:hypothetical protein
MKNTLIVGAFLIVGLTIAFFVIDSNKVAESPTLNTEQKQENTVQKEPEVTPAPSNERIANPESELADPNPRGEVPPVVPLSKLKVANFSGKLEKVDVGCFADGECFVEVDGKHVTAIMGWSQAVVGSVQGVDGFGDLESHIGAEVEVYAQDTGDGKYTLYGNEGFYIKLVK